MELTVEEKIKQTPEWDTAVYGATKLLEELAQGPIVNLAKVEWALVWYKDRFPGFLLRITDNAGVTAEGRFTLEELRDRRYLDGQLSRLWGGVLQERSRRQVDQLLQHIQELEGD